MPGLRYHAPRLPTDLWPPPLPEPLTPGKELEQPLEAICPRPSMDTDRKHARFEHRDLAGMENFRLWQAGQRVERRLELDPDPDPDPDEWFHQRREAVRQEERNRAAR